MLGLAERSGHQVTEDASQADVIVVNTCAFIDAAKRESVDTILELAQLKKDGACRRLIVTGCLAERYRNELLAEIPEIDAVLGTGEVPQIVQAIGNDSARLKPRATESPLVFFKWQPAGESRPSGVSRIPNAKSLPTYLYGAYTP